MLTGGFSWAGFYVAVVLNVPIAWLLLRLYRSAVVRAMRGPGVAEAGPPSIAPAAAKDELTIEVIDATTAPPGQDAARSAIAATALSGIVFVLIVVLGWSLTLAGKAYPLWVAWWMVLHAWPVTLACGLVAGATGSDWARWVGIHLVAFAAMSAVCLAAYPDLGLGKVLSNAATVLPVAIPVSALVYRRIRAVGLLVMAFLLALLVIAPPMAMGTLRFLVAALSEDSAWRRPLGEALLMVGADAVGVIVVVAGLLAGAVSGYAVLRLIGALYRRKRVSDESLLLDALWLVVMINHLLLLSTQHGGSSDDAWAVPVIAFAAYWACQHVLGRSIRRRATEPRSKAPLLLLLRVFSLGRRSEPMFDVLASRWLRRGPIVFIAGPDLAAGTVPPGNFLQFLAGRLARQFVARPSDARQRTEELDLDPDPDGRYRVNQLFCSGDTWKDAVLALAQRSDSVLMDLRSFSAQNDGCIHELRMLMHHVPIDRILLVVDDSTDQPFLQSTLADLWRAHGVQPAIGREARLRVVRIGRSSPRAMRAVARQLQVA